MTPDIKTQSTIPVLRAPPFPGAKLQGTQKRSPSIPPTIEPPNASERERIFEAMREAQVGGAFWGDRIDGSAGEQVHPPRIVLRVASSDEDATLRAEFAGEEALSVDTSSAADAIDPWSVLPTALRLVAHGDDEWVALASIAGTPVKVLTPGRFGNPGDLPDTLIAKAHAEVSKPMPDPFGKGWLDPLEAIALLGDWRRAIDDNRGAVGERIVAACGMSWWKRDEIARFLWAPGSPARIFRSTTRALAAAHAAGGALAVWSTKISPELEAEAERLGVSLVRIEDGFIRSVGLGSNLIPPLSVIVDRRGIHYDPSTPSDLEAILAETRFSQDMLDRASRLRQAIVDAGISKYASAGLQPSEARSASRSRVVLVPGQVEDDMSVIAGGCGLTSNLELLRRTRALEPDAEIWWRPHPDVDAGHRKGAVDDASALEHADRIVRHGSMAELLDTVDGVHVLTSLSGFEALLRGRAVTCHGVPFYSGWGLTRDLGDVPERRGRELSLDQLVAGVLVYYPRYLDPVTRLPCPPEVLVDRITRGEAQNRLGWVRPLRRAQGRLMARLRSVAGR